MNKRNIDANFYLETKVLQYLKKTVLLSKIILDEDFDGIVETPTIQLPAEESAHTHLFYGFASSLLAFGAWKCFRSVYYLSISCLPSLVLICIKYAQKQFVNNRCKEISQCVQVLDEVNALNRKVVKYLNLRFKSINELKSKTNTHLINQIQLDDFDFLKLATNSLHKICNCLQQQIITQSEYSGHHYQFIAKWEMKLCPLDDGFIQHLQHFQNSCDFFILLASNFFSSSVFALENASARSHTAFKVICRTFVVVVNELKREISMVNAQMVKLLYTFETSSSELVCDVKKHDKRQGGEFVYREVIEESKHRLKLVYDIVNNVEMQAGEGRCILLEDILHQFDELSQNMKNLLIYERANFTKRFDTKMIDFQETPEIKSQNLSLVDEDIGSDDELFIYTPNDSDNETTVPIDMKADSTSNDTKIAFAVQHLMLQELRDRMKDVKRLKITKTSDGDLIVHERPMTLEESGGQINSLEVSKNVITLDENQIPPAFHLPPPPPPLPDVNNDLINQMALPKSMLLSISSIAQQMHRPEDVFGDDLMDSDVELSEW